MSFIFRVMTCDGDKPAIGPTRRTLGVRIPPTDPADIPVDSSGNVAPNTGGMSVTPDWRSLKSYQIPRTLRHIVPGATGNVSDKLWRLGEQAFVEGPLTKGLSLRIDSPKHGIIEPLTVVPIAMYQDDLAATRDRWVILEG